MGAVVMVFSVLTLETRENWGSTEAGHRGFTEGNSI